MKKEEKALTDEEFRRDLNGLIGFLIIGMILATIIVFLVKGPDHFFGDDTKFNQTESATEIQTEYKCKCNTR